MSILTDQPVDPSATSPLAVLERMFHEGFATGDGAVVDEVCSPDVVEHQFGLAGSGAAAIASRCWPRPPSSTGSAELPRVSRPRWRAGPGGAGPARRRRPGVPRA